MLYCVTFYSSACYGKKQKTKKNKCSKTFIHFSSQKKKTEQRYREWDNESILLYSGNFFKLNLPSLRCLSSS